MTCRRGRRCPPIRRAASSTSRPTARRWTITAASVRATTCSARASSRSTSRPASASGTSSSSSTTSGTTTRRRRRAARRQRRRPPHSRAVPGHEAGLGLFLQPPHRRADLADGRAAGAAVEGAGRKAGGDAAAPDQAGAVRSAGPPRRRPDRLHARRSASWRSSARASAICSRRCSRRRRIAATPKARARRTSVRAATAARTSPGRPRPTRPPADLHHVDQRLLADDSRAGKERDNAEMTGQDDLAVGRGARRRRRRRRTEADARTIRWRAFRISSRVRSAASWRST